ncbi:MAG: 2-oxoglutarate dehydrogenase complex dihydrolipoyllysine-residue succinyltransferase [Gammaproteobacteria bacterium]|nr:2-oxoglutarate dehydrogenase complex dihydrolipoyllysine-residue succinyltransferase [Gammaproteobacteria bacterium]
MTDVKVPGFPESVADGTIITWHKEVGEWVEIEEVIADIETDKVVFEVPSPVAGVVTEILEPEGSVVLSAQVIAKIDENATVSPAPVIVESKVELADAVAETSSVSEQQSALKINPSAKKIAQEKGLDVTQIKGSGKGGRILKEDVQTAGKSPQGASTIMIEGDRPEKRVPMTRLRMRIAERLVSAQQTAALLTTFNEINMKPVMDVRAKYKDMFEKKHDTKLGFMSFFVKAVTEALKQFPEINASIDGDDIVYHGFFDVGIAVSSPRGLVVPILRDADQMNLAQIEAKIREFGAKAKDNKLGIDEITGGTFSVTNGGVFGSMLSTPILNPPQSAILGMHNIVERPVVENGEIVIRPIMYVALTYDHRIVDGREAVQFLVAIKNALEDPVRLLLDV